MFYARAWRFCVMLCRMNDNDKQKNRSAARSFCYFFFQFGALSAFTTVACRFDSLQHFKCHETHSHHVLHQHDGKCDCHQWRTLWWNHKRVNQPLSFSLGTFCVCELPFEIWFVDFIFSRLFLFWLIISLARTEYGVALRVCLVLSNWKEKEK